MDGYSYPEKRQYNENGIQRYLVENDEESVMKEIGQELSLEVCAERLRKHGFEVDVVSTIDEAGSILRQEIEREKPNRISYGDSMTVKATGIIDELRCEQSDRLIDGFDPSVSREVQLERRRQALLADLFFTGVNAVCMNGSLFWLDMIGNRIAPIAYGPKRVVLLVGRNKLVETPDEAVARIRQVAAPRNVARHPGFKTPCAVTGVCADCNSPQRICNTWLVMERCCPKERIRVVLIDQELGL